MANYSGFKVGEIMELEEISEKLKLLTVDVGLEAPLQVVTNVRGRGACRGAALPQRRAASSTLPRRSTRQFCAAAKVATVTLTRAPSSSGHVAR